MFQDCEECIQLEPTFIKGYLRKAKIECGLKQFSKAQESFERVLEMNPKHPDAVEGLKECMMSMSSYPKEVKMFFAKFSFLKH